MSNDVVQLEQPGTLVIVGKREWRSKLISSTKAKHDAYLMHIQKCPCTCEPKINRQLLGYSSFNKKQ